MTHSGTTEPRCTTSGSRSSAHVTFSEHDMIMSDDDSAHECMAVGVAVENSL